MKYLTSDCSNVYSTASDVLKHREESECVFSSSSERWDCVSYCSISIWCSDVYLCTIKLENKADIVVHFIPLQSDAGLILSCWYQTVCVWRSCNRKGVEMYFIEKELPANKCFIPFKRAVNINVTLLMCCFLLLLLLINTTNRPITPGSTCGSLHDIVAAKCLLFIFAFTVANSYGCY